MSQQSNSQINRPPLHPKSSTIREKRLLDTAVVKRKLNILMRKLMSH